MLNEIAFYATAMVTVVLALGAMTLRRPVHCALCAAGAFASLTPIYLQLHAEFIGFAQLMVYVGAVAILIVFAVLLTSGREASPKIHQSSRSWLVGIITAALILASIAVPVLSSTHLKLAVPSPATAPVKEIGNKLMTTYALPLEMTGVLLTAAMLGAVVIALREDVATKLTPRRVETMRPEREEELVTR